MRWGWPIPLMVSVLLGLPSLWALFAIGEEGPRAWGLSQTQPWGIPVAAFVFWIGLAHAGTFFSAILLLLNKPWRVPVALAAERMTLAALGATVLYPVLHLGLPSGALWMIPRVDSAGMGLELKSPLFWDFMAIGAYSMVSLAYYHLDRLGAESEAKRTRIRAMAWVLLPLVLTVHTIVSLDFATARVPAWGFAEWPVYFIAGALYSGVAAILLWSAFQKNMPWQKLVDLLLGLSWIMAVFWLFLAQKGHGVGWPVWWGGFLLPQLLWIPKLKCRRGVWMGVSLGVLGALFWERLELVWQPMRSFEGVDLGWLCVGGAVFFGLFALLNQPIVLKKQPIRPCATLEMVGVWGAGALIGGGILWLWISQWGLVDYWVLGPVMVPLVLFLVGFLLWIRSFFWMVRWSLVFGGVGMAVGAVVASVLLDLSPQWESKGPPVRGLLGWSLQKWNPLQGDL